MAEDHRCITLTTDFGTSGPFVGSMKAAILKANPDVTITDISHDIPRGDIFEAAFVLSCAYPYFPNSSIHIVVVDPTVGSDRKPILVSTENHYFLAPDNGVLSFVFQKEEIYNVIEITEDHFFNKPTSHTFHGRDIFAPVAGWLAKVQDTCRFGPAITEYERLDIPLPQEVKEKAWKGSVLHVDGFGNVITNLTLEEIPLDDNGYPTVSRVITMKNEIRHVRKYYSEQTDQDPFLLLGSMGYYEIAVNRGSASDLLELKKGSEIGVILR